MGPLYAISRLACAAHIKALHGASIPGIGKSHVEKTYGAGDSVTVRGHRRTDDGSIRSSVDGVGILERSMPGLSRRPAGHGKSCCGESFCPVNVFLFILVQSLHSMAQLYASQSAHTHDMSVRHVRHRYRLIATNRWCRDVIGTQQGS